MSFARQLFVAGVTAADDTHRDVREDLCAAVGMQSAREAVHFNFGPDFLFNVPGYVPAHQKQRLSVRWPAHAAVRGLV